jgi:hypothetical protein
MMLNPGSMVCMRPASGVFLVPFSSPAGLHPFGFQAKSKGKYYKEIIISTTKNFLIPYTPWKLCNLSLPLQISGQDP